MDPDRLHFLLLSYPILLLSLTAHEFAHAWVALREGDDTAYLLGRVTLDPRAHADPIGTVLFPILGILSGAPLLGWAKPVPVTTRKLRNYRSGDIRVSLAGIAANAILAVACAAIAALLTLVLKQLAAPPAALETLQEMMAYGVIGNVGLIVFNLLPIPPLDGSRVLYHFLSPQAGEAYRRFAPYGMLVLWGLVLTGALDVIRYVLFPIVNLLLYPAGIGFGA
ncbi:MAG TPA: site-2 protease family protein [Longimicrobium sp.]|nr:site-2 protease family protein [Longimicrobium sp.]